MKESSVPLTRGVQCPRCDLLTVQRASGYLGSCPRCGGLTEPLGKPGQKTRRFRGTELREIHARVSVETWLALSALGPISEVVRSLLEAGLLAMLAEAGESSE